MARNEKTKEYLEMVGLGSTDMDETLYLFSLGIPTDAHQLGCARCDWQALARFSPSVGGSDMFLPGTSRRPGAAPRLDCTCPAGTQRTRFEVNLVHLPRGFCRQIHRSRALHLAQLPVDRG